MRNPEKGDVVLIKAVVTDAIIRPHSVNEYNLDVGAGTLRGWVKHGSIYQVLEKQLQQGKKAKNRHNGIEGVVIGINGDHVWFKPEYGEPATYNVNDLRAL